MNKPWYQNFFSRPATINREIINTKANQGNADAQFSLGLESSADGVTQDYSNAARWYLKAAQQNHSLAQFNLGIMYAHGQGMPQNNAEALVWFNKAARLGDAGAQHHLGTESHRASVHSDEIAAKESRIEAYKWFRLAAAQDYRGSMGACEQIALRMTREDITEGDRRAAVFVTLNKRD